MRTAVMQVPSGTPAHADAGAATALRLPPPELLLLGAIWGASYLFARVAAQGLPSLVIVEIRLALGALVLLPALWRARASFTRRLWPRLAAIGFVNSALPSLLFAWAAHHAPAGVTALTSGLTVMFTALVGFVFFGERPGWQRALSWLIGFAGIAVLAAGRAGPSAQLLAVAAGVAGAACYGVGLHLVKRHLSALPAAAAAAASLGGPALLLLPLALASWPCAPVPSAAWGAAVALGVLCTGGAYVLFYRLVGRIGAAGTSVVTYLIPLFGVGWAWLLLDEALTLRIGVAAALILAGVACHLWAPAPRPRVDPAPARSSQG